MEIERKWLVQGWPDLPLLEEQHMRQGYISVEPTVRIREERTQEKTAYVLCFKSKGTLARKEIELEIPEEKFRELEDLIGKPLIPKERRVYALNSGLRLEVNDVDQGEPTRFMYAEVEFESIAQAKSWVPDPGLEDYLNKEVTGVPGESMGAYWERTRK